VNSLPPQTVQWRRSVRGLANREVHSSPPRPTFGTSRAKAIPGTRRKAAKGLASPPPEQDGEATPSASSSLAAGGRRQLIARKLGVPSTSGRQRGRSADASLESTQ
jgi:hypothetical protein